MPNSVTEYLRKLPDGRRTVMSEMRDLIRRNLPDGYEEAISAGMIAYQIPLERFPDTYNGQPLWYVGLAAQKNYYALHLVSVYMISENQQRLRDGFKKAGKKLDMGKGCIRFRKVDDLALDVIGQIIARTTPQQLIDRYVASRKAPRSRRATA